MYATAQRVSSEEGREGVNGFLHLHGDDFSWPPEPWLLPESDPGKLISEYIEVPPGGNIVRSYLDVLAPDRTPPGEIDAALAGLLLELLADGAGRAAPQDPLPNPVVYRQGAVVLRLGVEAPLLANRAAEMATLQRLVEPGTALWRRGQLPPRRRTYAAVARSGTRR